LSGTVLMTFNLFMTIRGQQTVKVRPPSLATVSGVIA